MIRRSLCTAVLLLGLCLSGCGKASVPPPAPPPAQPTPVATAAPAPTPTPGSEAAPPPAPTAPAVPGPITLTAAEHPELDFGLSDHDGEPVLRDFCFTPEGTLLVLQLSECIYEYAADGTLLGVYDPQLAEHGLSAFRIAAGTDGLIYLLDGRSNAVLCCTRDGLTRVSRIAYSDLDVGLLVRFFCDKAGAPCVTYVDLGHVHSITAHLDVSGETAVFLDKTECEFLDDDGSAYLATPTAPDGRQDGTLRLRRQCPDGTEQAVSIAASGEGAVLGLSFLGGADGILLGTLHTQTPDPDGGTKRSASLVRIDLETADLRVSTFTPPNPFAPAAQISSDCGRLYLMLRDACAIVVSPIDQLVTDWYSPDTLVCAPLPLE